MCVCVCVCRTVSHSFLHKKLTSARGEQLVVVVLSTWFVWQFSLDTACFERADLSLPADVDELPECSSYYTRGASAGNDTAAIPAPTDCPVGALHLLLSHLFSYTKLSSAFGPPQSAATGMISTTFEHLVTCRTYSCQNFL